MACCRTAHLFGKAHRVEGQNASTLVLDPNSCSASSRMDFHPAIADQNDSRRSWAIRVVCWGKRLFGIASLGSPSVRGANACSSVSRGHLADARLGRAVPHARCVDGAATRAAHAYHCDGDGRQHLVAVRLVGEGALARSKIIAQTGRFWLRFFTGPIRFSPSS